MTAQRKADVIESIIDTQKKEYLASLLKFKLKFSDVPNLGEFLISQHKQLFVIGTVDPTLEAARIYNILQQHYNTNINPTNSDNPLFTHGMNVMMLRMPMERFLGKNNQTFFDWKISGKFLKRTTLIKFTNLVVVDISNVLVNNPESTADLARFTQSVLKDSRKLIFICCQNSVEITQLFKTYKLKTVSKEISNISFSDLREDSQRQILTKSLFTFKGVPTSIVEFLKIDDFDVLSKEVIKRLNQIVDSEMLKLISDDRFVAKEISTHFYSLDIGYLNPTYLNIFKKISLHDIAAFINNIRSSSDGLKKSILILFDCPSHLKLKIENEVTESIDIENLNELDNFSLKFRSEVKESEFIQLCKNNHENRIYWIINNHNEFFCKKVYDTNFYIKRKYCDEVVLKPEIKNVFTQHSQIPDLFIFENVSNKNKLCDFFGIKEKELCKLQKRDNIVTVLEREECFNVELKRDIDRPVHLIRFDENRDKFCWIDSQGSLENLRNFVVLENEQVDAAELIKKKVIILGGPTSAGKFSCLIDLMRYVPKTSWTLKINLKSSQKLIQALPSIIETKAAIDFISAHFSDNSLISRLFADILLSNNTRLQLFLLFEEFDYILDNIECNDNKTNEINKISKLLQFFKKRNNIHTWIVSTRHMETLENMVSVFGTGILETDTTDQKNYLINSWTSKISGISLKNQKQLLDTYVDETIGIMQPILVSNKKHLDIPFQLRLLQELVQPCAETLTTNMYDVSGLIDITEILRRYLQIEYKLNSEMHQDQINFQVYLDFYFGKIAFKQLFPHFRNMSAFVLEPYEHTNYNFDVNKYSFLHSTEDGEIKVGHSVFVDFFSAIIIVNWFVNPKYLAAELLLTDILIKPKYKLLRLFLNNFIGSKVISPAASKDFAECICKYWDENTNQYNNMNQNQHTIFHIIVKEELINIALCFFNKNFSLTNVVASFFFARDEFGQTVLFLAAAQRLKAIIGIILECFSTVDTKYQERLYYSTIFSKPAVNDKETTKYLLNEIKKYIANFDFSEELQEMQDSVDKAVHRNDINELKILVGKMKNKILIYYLFLQTGEKGLTLFHLAASKGYVEIVYYLLKQKICVDHLDQHGANALHHAAKFGNVNVVKVLIKDGASLQALDKNNISPLEYAARRGHKETVQFLVEQGSDVNHRDAFGMAAISWAIKSGHLNIVQYLVSLKTDLTILDCYGRNLLQIAIQSKQWQVVNFLIFCDVGVNTLSYNSGSPLQMAIRMRNWDIAKLLILEGAQINILDEDSLSPIWYALRANKWNLVVCMIENGANIADLSLAVQNKILNYSLLKIHVHPKLPNIFFNKQYNAFYNLIRLGNIHLLEMLIKRENLEDDSKCETLVQLLAESYEELHLRKIPLSEEIKCFIEAKLVLMRGFGNIYTDENTVELNITERINSIICISKKVHDKYSGEGEGEVDQELIIYLQFISENIQTLKTCLRNTYNIVPWEEMEFCINIFITLFLKPRQDDFPFRAVLDQNRLLTHLCNFVKTLANLKDLGQNCNSTLERLKNIETIIHECPDLTTLFDDFNIIKDIYSLTRVFSYIEVALSVKNTRGQEIEGYAIQRCLQVIGESFKNTCQSPNLSESVQNYLLYFAPKNVKKILTTLRDTLSHSNTIKDRMKTESRLRDDKPFLESIQTDLKKIKVDVVEILSKKRYDALYMFWSKVKNSRNINDVKQLTRHMKIDSFSRLDLGDYQSVEMNKLESLLLELKEQVDDIISDFERSELTKILNYINKSRSESFNMEYFRNGQLLHFLINGGDFVTINNLANALVSYKLRVERNQLQIDAIYSFMNAILVSSLTEIRLCHQIFMILQLLVTKDKIPSIEYTEKVTSKTKNNSNNELIYLNIEKKLDILNRYLQINNIISLKTNRLILCGIEILALDVIDWLLNAQHTQLQLAQHKMSFEDYSPVLIGKSLRNYLAHGDCLIDALPFCPLYAIFSTIQNIPKIDTKLFSNKKKIGKQSCEKFENMINIATSQHHLFNNLKTGKIKEGDETKAINLLDTLALDNAIMSNNVDLMKVFFKKENVSITYYFTTAVKLGAFDLINSISLNIRDSSILSESLLIAAKYGHKDVVLKLLDLGASIDIKDENKMTPLEVAIKNGHNDIFIILLKSTRNNNINLSMLGNALCFAASNGYEDMFATLANRGILKNINKEIMLDVLCAATQNGHKDIVVILLKSNVDINAYWKGERTPLHIAVSIGHKAVIQVLLDQGADIEIEDTKEGDNSLLIACQNGFKDIVNLLIKKGANIKAKNKNERTALHYSAARGRTDVTRTLIKHGANVNSKAKENLTPLFEAANTSNKDVTEILINSKANVHAKNSSGWTALHRAASNGYEDVVICLLTHGAKQNVKTIGGFTVLHLAARNGHQYIVQYLLANGANINSDNDTGETALSLAAAHNHYDIVADLLNYDSADGVRINTYDKNSRTALFHATLRGFKEVVNILLSKGAQIQFSILNVAVQCGHKDIFEILLNHGRDCNVIYEDQPVSPLRIAARHNQVDIVNLLIHLGADVNQKAKNQTSALYQAVQCGFLEVVELLLEKGADVNTEEYNKLVALHIAVAMGFDEIALALINREANIDAADENNWTALHIAALYGYENIVNHLLQHGACVNANIDVVSPLYQAATFGHDKIVNCLIDHGATVDFKEHGKLTPLYVAAQHGHSKVVESLLIYKADINFKEKENDFTALHVAASRGHLDVVLILLKHRVDVYCVTKSNFTALELAAQNGHQDIVIALLIQCVDIYGKFNIGSAVYAAADNGHTEVVKILLNHEVNNEGENQFAPLHVAVIKGKRNGVVNLVANGADINTMGKIPITPLLLAILCKFEDIVGDLLSRDADVNVKYEKNMTALHYAASSGHRSIVVKLLNYGSNINAVNDEGETVLCAAVRNGHTTIVTYLLDHDANVNASVDLSNNTALHRAALNGYENIVLILIMRGAEVNAINDMNHFPLFNAAEQGKEEATRVLINHRANKNAGNGNKLVSALSIATENNHLGTVKCLLSHGADANHIDILKRTALHIATFRGYASIALELIKYGANVNKFTETCGTPLHLAESRGMSHIKAILQRHGALR